jgi:guanylate kinase
VVTGPSGVGKTYLAEELVYRFPLHFKSAKLYTTRVPRAGEQGSDRIFISKSDFKSMTNQHKFAVTGRFHNNYYGYTYPTVQPQHQHLIVNTWPAMVPAFTPYPSVLFVALGIKPANYSLVENRMLARGDSAIRVAERMKIVTQDMTALEQQIDIIRTHGRLFYITDDSNIPKQVIPWLIEKLALQTEGGV